MSPHDVIRNLTRAAGRMSGLPLFGGASARAACAQWSAALLAAAMLSACFSSEGGVAGGDDFPNSVETLGKAAADERADSTEEWNAYRDAPSTPPGVYDSTDAPDGPPENDPPAKRPAEVGVAVNLGNASDRVPPGREIAGAVRAVVQVPDTGGLVRAVRMQTLGSIEARDTTWYRTEGVPPARRALRSSGVVTYAGVNARSERFAYEDADGDGVLTPAGARSLSRARFTVTYPSGRTENRTVVFSAGPDLSFQRSVDNVHRFQETVHVVGGDTVLRITLRPLPGDSAYRDPARAVNHVDVEHVARVAGVTVTRRYRAEVRADSARNRATRFTREVETAAGVTVTELLGRDSMPDFAPGDTGRVRVTFAGADARDSLLSSETVYRVRLADTAQGHAGNRLLGVERDKVFRSGPVAAVRWSLTPVSPVIDGERPRDGDVALRVDLRGGGWVNFVGSADSSGFTGVWSDSLGRGGAVRFDAQGRIRTP